MIYNQPDEDNEQYSTVEANTTSEYSTVLDKARQLDTNSNTLFNKTSQKKKNYKYDDALKFRFPEQRSYVTAHNYIPSKSFKTGNDGRTKHTGRDDDGYDDDDDYRDNLRQNAANKLFKPPSSIVKQSKNATSNVNATIKKFESPSTSYNRGHVDRNGNNQTHVERNAKANKSIRSTDNSDDYLKGHLHPLSLAQVTNDKVYFRMQPLIYNYGENQYKPLTVDTNGQLIENTSNKEHVNWVDMS